MIEQNTFETTESPHPDTDLSRQLNPDPVLETQISVSITNTHDAIDADPDDASDKMNEAPIVPAIAYDLQVLQSLRRLIRAADLFSRRLIRHHKVTGPQLTCLHKILEHDGLTVSALSKAIYLSPSTVVGILDRLEKQGLVTRIRSSADRRKVLIHVTQLGRELVAAAPSPLQDALRDGLSQLETKEQRDIAGHVAKLVAILELDELDAAPIFDTHSDFKSYDYEDEHLGEAAHAP